MPEMTGIELITHVRQIRPDIAVIICSGYSEQINQESAKTTEIHYLSKPVNSSKLFQLTAELLELG